MRYGTSVIVLLAALGASARASAAEHDDPSPEQPVKRALHVGLDSALTTSPNGPTVSALGGALRLTGAYQFASGLGVSLAGGFTAVSLDIDAERSRRGTFPGNLLLGVSLERGLAPQLEARASLRVGAPLALNPGGIDDNRLADLAYTLAASAQGFLEPFIWQQNVVPLVLGAEATLRVRDWLVLSGGLSPAYLVSVNQRPSRAALASHVDAAARYDSFIAHLGLSHFVSTLALENRHLDQLALRFGAGVLVNGQRVLLDMAVGLDAPYGAFESAPHPWWGIGIVVDAQFGAER